MRLAIKYFDLLNTKYLFCAFFLIVFSVNSFCQVSKNQKSNSDLNLNFLYTSVEFEEITSLTNVLKIKNTTKKLISFNIKVALPSGWRCLLSADKDFSVDSMDSIFVPVRIIGNKQKIKGGVSYGINAILTDVETGQVKTIGFLASLKKSNQLSMDVSPGKKIYLLNNENKAKFDLLFSNQGKEDEKVILTLNKTGANVMISDTAGKFLKKTYIELNLKAQSDTVLPFNIFLLQKYRNFKRIDNYSYLVTDDNTAAANIYIYAKQPISKKKSFIDSANQVTPFQMNKNIHFIKLTDEKKVNQFGSSCLPITFVSNINFFNSQPILNTILNGNYKIDEKSSLFYFAQTNFSYYTFGKQTLDNFFGNIGYFHTKGSLQIGSNTNFNLPFVRILGTNGLGVSGTYVINPKHTVGVSLSNSNATSTRNLSLGYSGKFKLINFGIGLSHQTSVLLTTQLVSGGVSYNINSNQTISSLAGLNRYQTLSGINTYAQNYNLNYLIRYLNSKASSNISLSYNQIPINYFSNTALNNSYNANLFNLFTLKKNQQLNSQHTFSSYDNFNSSTLNYQKNISFYNIITYNKNSMNITHNQPGVYINYSDFLNQQLMSFGFQLTSNLSNYEKNLRLGSIVSGGFNKLINYPTLPNFFTGQVSLFAVYRVFNVNVFYQYGPRGQTDIVSALTSQPKYYQSANFRISHQYQFSNKHFLLENNFVYNYINTINRQNINIFSQLYYYTTSGWRLNLNLGYTYNTSQTFKYNYAPGSANQYLVEKSDIQQSNYNFQLSLGAKKDFCIPLPKRFAKKRFADARFKAFIDMNGNRKFDIDEIELENIIVRLDNNETQTNKIGEVVFKNIDLGKYKFSVTNLEDIGAWFAVVKDSVDITGDGINFIPFSKGIEVMGNIEIDRDKFSSDLNGILDISKIRILLIDSSGNNQTSITNSKGEFKFYVPQGKYILQFDEKILGSDFEVTDNDIELELDKDLNTYYHTFYIIERRRKINKKKFNASGELIDKQTKKTETKIKQTTQSQIDSLNAVKLKKEAAKIKSFKLRYLDSLTIVLNKMLNDTNRNNIVNEAIKLKAQEVRDQIDVNFTLRLLVLAKNKKPNGLLSQLIRLNSIDSVINTDGSQTYYTGSFKTILEAEQEALNYRKKGMKKTDIVTQTIK